MSFVRFQSPMLLGEMKMAISFQQQEAQWDAGVCQNVGPCHIAPSALIVSVFPRGASGPGSFLKSYERT